MQLVTVPSGEPLVDLSLPSAEPYAGALKALVRLRDEAAAEVDRLCAPINLVAADIWFQDSDLAGLAVVQMKAESMGDTLRRGDFALIDTAQTEIADGGVFAILENNESVIIYQVEGLSVGAGAHQMHAARSLLHAVRAHGARGPKGHTLSVKDADTEAAGFARRLFLFVSLQLPLFSSG
jgi:hypothetical protein